MSDPALASEGQERARSTVTRRSVVIGLALIPLNVYWVIVAELRWYVILTLNPLFVTPIFCLFVLVAVNGIIGRIAPKHVLKPAELVVIYVMLVLSCTIATHDYIINLMSSIAWPSSYATGENQWETQLFPHLPKWLFVWDKRALAGYFSGSTPLYQPEILRAWLAPLAFWSIFIFASGWIMLCMNVMIRRAWVDETRLSFPTVRLPFTLTEGFSPGSMLRSHAIWLGFAAAVGLALVNGLHEWYPNVPSLPVRAQWVIFPTPPWNATWPLCVTFYPFAIGLAYLVPLDVSFSCWFFYLFAKAQAVAGWQLGYGGVRDFPFVMEQGIGAWTAFGVALVYLSRRHLARVVRFALEPRQGRDAGEPMSYRTAFWGLVIGMLIFFGFWRAAGMGAGWVLLVMGAYLLLALCITRVRAEAGGQHTVWDLEPRNTFRLFDSQMLGPTNLAAAAVSHWYWRLNRSHMMPAQLESFKLAQDHGMNLRSLVTPMLAALVIAVVFGMWACLQVFYGEGALKCAGYARWTGIESYDWLATAIKPGFQAEPSRWLVVGGAAGFTVLLSWMRARFPWWPFHPLGYCIGPGLIWMWFPFFIAWAAKLVILRYGGLRLYRQALPFFLGLILGDYVSGAAWSLIGVIWHLPVYQTFH